MDGIHYRDPKAMRMCMEQLEKKLRRSRERDAAIARRQELLDCAAQLRRDAERAEQQAIAIEAAS